MHILNNILGTLDIDSEAFRFTDQIPLYDSVGKKPFGMVSFQNGHYRLTVGDIDLIDHSFFPKHR